MTFWCYPNNYLALYGRVCVPTVSTCFNPCNTFSNNFSHFNNFNHCNPCHNLCNNPCNNACNNLCSTTCNPCNNVCNPCNNNCNPCNNVCNPCPNVTFITNPATATTITSNPVGTAPTPIPAGSTVIPAGTVVPITGFSGTPIVNCGGITVNSGTGQFTIPISGRYIISGSVIFSPNATGTREVYIYRVSGTSGIISLLASDSRNATAVGTTNVTVTTTADLLAGDRIFFAATQNSGSSITAQIDSRYSITRVC